MPAGARSSTRRLGLAAAAIALTAAVALPAGAAAPPEITPTAPPDGTVGVAYAHQFQGTPAGASWAVTAGTLPAGLTLDAGTGLLAGTPTSVGTSGSITVEATWALPLAGAEVSSGFDHTCARLPSDELKCWGRNDFGQLGSGDTVTRGDDAGEMGDDLLAIDLGTGRTATAISTGTLHSCAPLQDATVKCWGRNTYGQLGSGDTVTRGDDAGEMGDDLLAIDLGTGRTATAISSGSNSTCALLDDATVKCWGRNTYGQLGLGDTATRGDGPGEMGDDLPAVDLGTGRTASTITAGQNHTCAVLDNAAIKCWGDNAGGQLGLGDTVSRGDDLGEMGDDLPEVDLGTGHTATFITSGTFFTCALLDDATVKCWGPNDNGQLGLGDTEWRGDGPGEMGDELPAVDLGTGRTATSIEAATSTMCAILDVASIKCWGEGGYIGSGDIESRGDDLGEMGDNLAAIDLGSDHTAGAISVGGFHTCAVLDNARLKCWGANGFGQLGLAGGDGRGDGPGEMGDDLPAVDLGTATTTDTQTFSITIASPGTVSGTVIEDGTGTPLGAISVRLFDGTTGTLLAVRSTDAAGGYAFTSLAPATYLVRFIDMNGSHNPEYHSNAATRAAATTVAVTSGATTDVDASLTPAGTGTISGTVTEQGSGTPLPGISVRLLTTGNVLITNRTTNATGAYSFGLRNHGSYLVRTIDPDASHIGEFHLNAATRFTATVVNHSAWITTIDAALAPAP